jgi:hypothetical protein
MSARRRLIIRLAVAVSVAIMVLDAVLGLDEARYGHFLAANAAAPWIALATIVIGSAALSAGRRWR